MATYRANLLLRRDAVAAELAAMTATAMGGMANVKSADGGTTIDHVGYRKSLLEELRSLNDELKRVAELEAVESGEDGPFEIETIMDA